MLEPSKVKGFDTLGESQTLFKEFLENFYNAWGLEARETIKPISVKAVKDNKNGDYLRFDYKIYNRKEWLHVKDNKTWY